MPCFLAGASQGQSLAHVLGVPFYAFSHQQGHLAAAAWSAGRMDLLDRPSWLGTCPAAPRSCCGRSRRRTAWPSGRRSWVGRQTSPPDS